MNFSPNSSFLYILAALVILFVLAQSVFFLVRAYRRAEAVGMDMTKLKKTMVSTAVFTIAPAVSILLGVITLSKFLGLPLPWIRLSVVGAITYELPAATSSAAAFGVSISETITDPKIYSAIAWVMTLGILPSVILPPILMKPIQNGLLKLRDKGAGWSDYFMDALFMGMIASFSGMVFAKISQGLSGWIPVFVMLFSAALMLLCGLLIKRYRLAWLENYAISISMIGAMLFAMWISPAILG